MTDKDIAKVSVFFSHINASTSCDVPSAPLKERCTPVMQEMQTLESKVAEGE